ncbi:putative Zinc finger C2H2-type [Septoria linicola]|nr:putative Zinc finger C2H2-type [Septoria linicola]
MTRFEESALRNSVAEQSPSTLPYWHPSSQFSSLIDPHDGQSEQLQYQALASQQMPPPSQHSSSDHSAAYSQYNEISQLAQDFATVEQPPTAHYGPGLDVKTPTGIRTMRRPGLAGASALVCGRYCCHWTVNGAACHAAYEDAKSLNEHIRSHHVRGAGSFVCQWQGCEKGSFPTANKLVRHVHSHTGYKPFQCPSCVQAFVTKDQLDKHLTTHTGAKDFVCNWPGCGRSFAVKHALDGHMNSVHLKAKKHVCPHCAQAFDDSSNLSKHKKQVHNPETGIRCPARHTHGCTYVDSRKDKMKEHCERDCHGLEIANDPHKWNLWVQQFKSASKKAESRRSRDISGTPMSRGSSISSMPFAPTPFRVPSIECSKQGCNIPVCLPCNILCNDYELFPDPLQPCDEAECDPCGPCNDPDCDPATRHECEIEPCTIQHNDPCNLQQACSVSNCRSATSTPSQPPTPHGAMPQPAFYAYHPIATESDPFHDAEHPFQLNSTQLNDYMFMNQ